MNKIIMNNKNINFDKYYKNNYESMKNRLLFITPIKIYLFVLLLVFAILFFSGDLEKKGFQHFLKRDVFLFPLIPILGLYITYLFRFKELIYDQLLWEYKGKPRDIITLLKMAFKWGNIR